MSACHEWEQVVASSTPQVLPRNACHARPPVRGVSCWHTAVWHHGDSFSGSFAIHHDPGVARPVLGPAMPLACRLSLSSALTPVCQATRAHEDKASHLCGVSRTCRAEATSPRLLRAGDRRVAGRTTSTSSAAQLTMGGKHQQAISCRMRWPTQLD